MVDFGESDQMIKVSGKMEKSDTYKKFSRDISSFISKFLQTKHFTPPKKKLIFLNAFSEEILD